MTDAFHPCERCGRQTREGRRLCGRCYKQGYTIRQPFCPDCGKPTETRRNIYCPECRVAREKQENVSANGNRRMAGIERWRMMKVAEKALPCDKYAQDNVPISDAEYDALVDQLRALTQGPQIGRYASPLHSRKAEASYGGFGAMANMHMRGGAAGAGRDRRNTERREEQD